MIDTAKAANLYVSCFATAQSKLSPYPSFSVYKDADLFDFINAPVGKGQPIDRALHPLIAGILILYISCDIPKVNYNAVATSSNHCWYRFRDDGHSYPGYTLYVFQDRNCQSHDEAHSRHC